MTVCVLICTYNRHELLSRALASLIEGTLEKPDQIVVVNGGDERADRVVESFAEACRKSHGIELKLVRTVNKNAATSRNVGLAHCTGDIIAVTDDDAEVFPDWITQLKCVHREQPDAGAVGGPVLGTNTDHLVGKVADLITFPSWPQARPVRTLPTVNIAYKRDVVERVGMQDEVLFCGEDVDYNWRVQQLGYSIYFHPEVRVYHHHRPSLRGFVRQHYRYGRGYYLVRRKWPDMYCVYPHGIHRLRDCAKAVNTVAALFYQPLLSSACMPSISSRLAAIPLLFLIGVAWKSGMLVQALRALTLPATREVPQGT